MPRPSSAARRPLFSLNNVAASFFTHRPPAVINPAAGAVGEELTTSLGNLRSQAPHIPSCPLGPLGHLGQFLTQSWPLRYVPCAWLACMPAINVHNPSMWDSRPRERRTRFLYRARLESVIRPLNQGERVRSGGHSGLRGVDEMRLLPPECASLGSSGSSRDAPGTLAACPQRTPACPSREPATGEPAEGEFKCPSPGTQRHPGKDQMILGRSTTNAALSVFKSWAPGASVPSHLEPSGS